MRIQSSVVSAAVLVASLVVAPSVVAQAGRGTPPAPPAAPAQPAPPAAPAPPTAAQTAASTTSYKVDFVLTRFQADKKLSSLPYSMIIASGRSNATLRSGSQVPIPGKDSNSISYQSIGVNVTVQSVTAVGDGRYSVWVQFDDSSVLETTAQGGSPMGPVIRSNSFASTVLVRDGQPLQFSVATDKFSGETSKAELTLTVLR